MTKIEAVKLTARLVVGLGTTTITNSIIRNNVSPSNPLEVVTVAAASVVLGSMASSAARSHTDAQIDSFVEVFQKNSDASDPVTA